MNDVAKHSKYCILGAGPCGLVAAKTFAERNIPFDCFEKQDDVGGNWYFGKSTSSVYKSTYMISSKRMTEFTDFPMPKEFPPYPHHTQALAYLRNYAKQFELYQQIEFETTVSRVAHADDHWSVEVIHKSGKRELRKYAGVVIANGHHWDPLLPEFNGRFSGTMLHSHDYKCPDQLQGKRVLVIGAGNSGCDIAVESSRHAQETLLSMRRGYHFLPKFMMGRPIDSGGDRLFRWRLPLWLYRWISHWLIRISLGSPENYGLPKPDHRLFETHPIINSQLLYSVGHGAVKVKPSLQEFNGHQVRFSDGSQHEVDVVVCATGYRVSFPFLDEHVLGTNGGVNWYANVFHPSYDSCFVVGLIQPNSAIWKLADYQAQLVASYIVARHQDNSAIDWFEKRRSRGDDLSGGIRFVDSPRHRYEVQYYHYRKLLKQLLRQFGRYAKMTLDGTNLKTHK